MPVCAVTSRPSNVGTSKAGDIRRASWRSETTLAEAIRQHSRPIALARGARRDHVMTIVSQDTITSFQMRTCEMCQCIRDNGQSKPVPHECNSNERMI